MTLYKHQRDGIERLVNGIPTYLGFDMGIGKSRTFIEACKEGAAERVLIVCPASAILVWKDEIARWAPNDKFQVVKRDTDLSPAPGIRFFILSHGLLSQKNGPVAEALGKTAPFDMTALDEAHAFNAPGSLRVKVLRAAAKNLGRIVPLSGTPMRNHAGDLYTLLSICWPQGLRTASGAYMTRTDYENTFCVASTRNFGGHMVRVIDGSKNIPKLRELIRPFMMRVRKEDVLKDLPPIQWSRVPVPLDMSLVNKADLDKLEQMLDAVTGLDIDALSDALSVWSHDIHLMSLRRMLGVAKIQGAFDYIVDMLDNLPRDRKVLVFGVHAEVIATLDRLLANYKPAVLTGKNSPAEREAAVRRFLNDPASRVFIGNIQAAGTAITLIGPTCKCSDVVFVESSWTPADNAQAACRVHRIGQHDGVNARMLYGEDTVDELIADILARKARDFSALFDGQAATTPQPTGETVS